MAKELIRNVYVDGVLYGPDGKQPSADVAKEITNPKAWGGDDSEPAGPSFPEGEPSEDWKVGELDAYAADKGVDLAGTKTKADKVAAITAAASA